MTRSSETGRDEDFNHEKLDENNKCNVLMKLPVKLREKLMPFQKDGVRFAVSKNGRCLIADEMGLGKTIQAISIAYIYKDEWPLLIIVPSSLKFCWIEELEKWLPDILPHEINLVQSGSDISGMVACPITIVTYGLLRLPSSKVIQEALSRRKFQVVICDESHYLKNINTLSCKTVIPIVKGANRRLLLSGTPALAKPVELYPQVDAICPGKFGSFWQFTDKYCDAHNVYFGKFRKRKVDGASNLEELQQRLQSMLMIRREKSEVLTELPPKQRQKIMFELKNSSLKKEIFDTFAELKRKIQKGDGAAQKVTAIEHLAVNMGSDLPYLNLLSSDKGSTGIYRLISRLYRMSGEAKIGPVRDYIEMLCEDEQLKFLVFAYHRDMMDGIQQTLWERKVKFVRIDGDTRSSDRQTCVNQYQSDPEIRVAILSILAAGVGLTFTAAKLVVFSELYWTPGVMVQCEDRAHRIGQTISLPVHYLVARDTMDEWVWSAVCRKTLVTSTALTGKTKHMDHEDGNSQQIELLSNAEMWKPEEDNADINMAELFQSQRADDQPSILDFFKSQSSSFECSPTRKRKHYMIFRDEKFAHPEKKANLSILNSPSKNSAKYRSTANKEKLKSLVSNIAESNPIVVSSDDDDFKLTKKAIKKVKKKYTKLKNTSVSSNEIKIEQTTSETVNEKLIENNKESDFLDLRDFDEFSSFDLSLGEDLESPLPGENCGIVSTGLSERNCSEDKNKLLEKNVLMDKTLVSKEDETCCSSYDEEKVSLEEGKNEVKKVCLSHSKVKGEFCAKDTEVGYKKSCESVVDVLSEHIKTNDDETLNNQEAGFKIDECYLKRNTNNVDELHKSEARFMSEQWLCSQGQTNCQIGKSYQLVQATDLSDRLQKSEASFKSKRLSPHCNTDCQIGKYNELDQTNNLYTKEVKDKHLLSSHFNQWSCSSCTFFNHAELPRCELCDTPKKKSTSKFHQEIFYVLPHTKSGSNNTTLQTDNYDQVKGLFPLKKSYLSYPTDSPSDKSTSMCNQISCIQQKISQNSNLINTNNQISMTDIKEKENSSDSLPNICESSSDIVSSHNGLTLVSESQTCKHTPQSSSSLSNQTKSGNGKDECQSQRLVITDHYTCYKDTSTSRQSAGEEYFSNDLKEVTSATFGIENQHTVLEEELPLHPLSSDASTYTLEDTDQKCTTADNLKHDSYNGAISSKLPQLSFKFSCSIHTGRIYVYDEDEHFLQASFHPVDVEMGNIDEFPEVLQHPQHLRLLQKFAREWSSLTDTKRRLIAKRCDIFASPLAAYETIKTVQGSKQRHLNKQDTLTSALKSVAKFQGSIQVISKHAAPTHLDANPSEASVRGIAQVVTEDGVPLCLQCQKPFSSPLLSHQTISNPDNAWQLRLCSFSCMDQFWIHSQAGYCRDQVYDLQRGVCQLCLFDAHGLFNQIRITKSLKERANLIKSSPYRSLTSSQKKKMVENPLAGQFWHVDHIMPVWQGGGLCDLDNLRTLCTPCHLQVTRKQAGQRATMRKLSGAAIQADITAFFQRT